MRECFYSDIFESFKPLYGVIVTNEISIERANGASFTNYIVNGEEFKTYTPELHHYRWNQNYIGLKCKIYKKDGISFVKEFNIANLVKKLYGWKYLTIKRIKKVKDILYQLDGTKVDIENTNKGYRISNLKNILTT